MEEKEEAYLPLKAIDKKRENLIVYKQVNIGIMIGTFLKYELTWKATEKPQNVY